MPWRVLRKARLRDPWPSETCRLSFDTSTPKYSMAHSWRELGLDWVERSRRLPAAQPCQCGLIRPKIPSALCRERRETYLSCGLSSPGVTTVFAPPTSHSIYKSDRVNFAIVLKGSDERLPQRFPGCVDKE